MSGPGNLVHRAQRRGRWAENKWTNSRPFDAGRLECDHAFDKYNDEVVMEKGISIRQLKLHPAFLRPVSVADVRTEFSKIPRKFCAGLDAVFLLGGSNGQVKSFRSQYAYGRYRLGIIYLHAYPRKHLSQKYKAGLKPSYRIVCERAGAVVGRAGDEWEIRFDKVSLRAFYLRDVLMHELGHHVDCRNFDSKPNRKVEGFAEWFATEYGYRLRRGPQGRR